MTLHCLFVHHKHKSPNMAGSHYRWLQPMASKKRKSIQTWRRVLFQIKQAKIISKNLKSLAQCQKLDKVFKGSMWKLLLRLMVNSDVYRSFIPNTTAFIKYCLTHWISKLLWSIEIHWVRLYLVNFTGLVGTVDAPVYKTEPIFISLGAWQTVLIFNTASISHKKNVFILYWIKDSPLVSELPTMSQNDDKLPVLVCNMYTILEMQH